MKAYNICMLISLVVSINSSAVAARKVVSPIQDTCLVAGVYATYQDFVKNHLTSELNLNEKGNALNIDMINGKANLTVITKDTSFHYQPGSIFGYRKCEKKFRYHKDTYTGKEGNYYQIEEIGKLVVYSLSQAHNGGKSHLHYYYSLGLEAPIKPLKEENLTSDYKDNTAFLESLSILKDKNGKYNLSAKDNEGHFTVKVLFEHFSKK